MPQTMNQIQETRHAYRFRQITMVAPLSLPSYLGVVLTIGGQDLRLGPPIFKGLKIFKYVIYKM